MLSFNKKSQELIFLIFTTVSMASIMTLGYYFTYINYPIWSILIYSSLILYAASTYKKIYGYIIKEHLVPFLLCMFAMIFVLLAQFLIKQIDKFLGKGLDITVLIEMIYYSMAAVVALAVPMAILVCTLMAFGRLSADNEITAMKASGIQYYNLIIPPILLSTVVAVTMIYFNNWILPDMNYQSKKIISDITSKNLEIIFEPKQLNTQLEGFTIYFDSIEEDLEKSEEDDGKNFFKNVFITQHNRHDNSIIRTIVSKKAYRVNDFNNNHIIILLKNGTMYQKIDDSQKYRIIQFDENQIKIDKNHFAYSGGRKQKGDRELNYKEIQDTIKFHVGLIDETKKRIRRTIGRIDPYAPVTYPFNFTANYYIEEQKKLTHSSNKQNIEKYYNDTQRLIEKEKKRIHEFESQIDKFRVEMHKKFSLPVACIIFILVGAPLGVVTRKGKFSINIGISLTFFLIYWAFLIGGENFADKGSINPALAMWLPNIVLLIVGIYLNYRINNGQKIFKMPNLTIFKKNK